MCIHIYVYLHICSKLNNTDPFLSFCFLSIGIAGLKPASSFMSIRVLSKKFLYEIIIFSLLNPNTNCNLAVSLQY